MLELKTKLKTEEDSQRCFLKLVFHLSLRMDLYRASSSKMFGPCAAHGAFCLCQHILEAVNVVAGLAGADCIRWPPVASGSPRAEVLAFAMSSVQNFLHRNPSIRTPKCSLIGVEKWSRTSMPGQMELIAMELCARGRIAVSNVRSNRTLEYY